VLNSRKLAQNGSKESVVEKVASGNKALLNAASKITLVPKIAKKQQSNKSNKSPLKGKKSQQNGA